MHSARGRLARRAGSLPARSLRDYSSVVPTREGRLGARKERERPVFSKNAKERERPVFSNAVESTEYSCGQKTKLAKYDKALYCEVMREKAKCYRKYYEKTPQCLGASKAFLNRRYTKSGNCKGTFTPARVYLVTLLRLRALLS